MKKLSRDEMRTVEGGLRFCCQVTYDYIPSYKTRWHSARNHIDSMIITTYGVKSGKVIVEWGY